MIMPTSIPSAQLLAAIRSLGIDPEHLVEVVLDLTEVSVTTYRLNAHGQREMTGSEPVTDLTIIPVMYT